MESGGKGAVNNQIGKGRLHYEIWLPRPREELFAFFSNAENLEELTPPWVNFKILTQKPIEMKAGTLLEYRLGIRGVPVQWITEITEWNPPAGFVDVQKKGPCRVWEHRHTLVEEEGGTRMVDEVNYAAPGGGLVERWLVRPDLKRIFEYRAKRMAELFPKI